MTLLCPGGKPGLKRVVLLSVEDIAYKYLEAQHSFTSDHGFSIYVHDVVDRRMILPKVTIRGKGKSSLEVTAAEGQLVMDDESQSLVLKLIDSKVVRGQGLKGSFPGERTFQIPIGRSMDESDVNNRRPSELPLRFISSQQSQERKKIHASIGQVAAQTGFALLTSRMDEIGNSKSQKFQSQLKSSRKTAVTTPNRTLASVGRGVHLLLLCVCRRSTGYHREDKRLLDDLWNVLSADHFNLLSALPAWPRPSQRRRNAAFWRLDWQRSPGCDRQLSDGSGASVLELT